MPREEYVNADTLTFTYSKEGKNTLIYWARDKEGNQEKDHRIELRLDKTPPDITSTINPQPNASGWHNSDVTVTFNSTDKLSGVKSVTQPITVTTEGLSQIIKGEAVDIADNKSTTQMTLNIDKTPPSVIINASPSVLWPADNKMVDVTISGEAEDNLSGIESLTFVVKDEYGKCQPIITSFGSTIKLKASRDGNDKDGRIYTISATAKDKAGNESTVSTVVTVPHDMGKKE